MLDRTAGEALLARVDAALSELAEIRRQVAALLPPVEENGLDADDLADGNLLDTTSAAERFSYDRHTLARWCRMEGLGIRRGGRWWVSVPRLQRRINGRG